MLVDSPWILRLRGDVQVHGLDEKEWHIVDRGGRGIVLRSAAKEARLLVAKLAGTGGTTGDLLQEVPNTSHVYYLLFRLERHRLLRAVVECGGRVWADFVPLLRANRAVPPGAEDSARWRLSRYAVVRREGEVLLLENPAGPGPVRFHHSLLASWLGPLVEGASLTELVGLVAPANPAVGGLLLQLLASAGIVDRVDPCTGEPSLDRGYPLRAWEPHDLWAQAAAMSGRQEGTLGGSFPHEYDFPHPPALRKVGPEAIRLPDPTPWPSLSFGEVIEERRSRRVEGEGRLDLARLSRFLAGVARVQFHRPADPDHPRRYEAVYTPSAGGGGMGEIELLLCIRSVASVFPGLYAYQGRDHVLLPLPCSGDRRDKLARTYAGAAGLERPDVVFVLSAHWARMSWKYEKIVGAVILRDAGALYQQMYLVATALGLHACGTGTVGSTALAEATGEHPWERVAVGGFLLSG